MSSSDKSDSTSAGTRDCFWWIRILLSVSIVLLGVGTVASYLLGSRAADPMRLAFAICVTVLFGMKLAAHICTR